MICAITFVMQLKKKNHKDLLLKTPTFFNFAFSNLVILSTIHIVFRAMHPLSGLLKATIDL